MSSFSERFQQARASAGLSVQQIAKHFGVSVQSVYGWENGSLPRADRMENLADYLGVDLQWLTYGGDECKSFRNRESDSIVVPLLDVRMSAGSGAFKGNGRVTRLMELDAAWVRDNLVISSATGLALCNVMGDSMTPTLNNNDIVLVDSGVTEILQDGIFAAELDGAFFIKRFQRIPGKKLLMISDNHFYKEIEVDPTKVPFTVMGQALWTWQGKRLY